MTRSGFALADLPARFVGAALSGDRNRTLRLALAPLLCLFMASGAGSIIAAAWGITVAGCELALIILTRRRMRTRHSAHDVGAAMAAALIANLSWAAGPVALWLCAPEFGAAATLWLAGHIVYLLSVNRRGTAAFLIAAAPHGAALLAIVIVASWNTPAFAAQAGFAASLLALMAFAATTMNERIAAQPVANQNMPTERAVLLIDGDADLRKAITETLTPLGYNTLVASDAATGLAHAGALKPALILLSARLGDRSGWDVLQALAAAPETAAIPVITLSALDDRQHAMALGARDHFIKPVDLPRLAAAILRCARVKGPRIPAPAPIARRTAKTA